MTPRRGKSVNPSTPRSTSRSVDDVDIPEPSPHADEMPSVDQMTDDEKRTDQLTRDPKSGPEDAAPRITTTQLGGVTRIDVADTAVVRPGNPDKQHGS